MFFDSHPIEKKKKLPQNQTYKIVILKIFIGSHSAVKAQKYIE